MIALLCFFLVLLAAPFKSKNRLGAENTALRHQLIVLQRKVRGRVHFTNSDRLFFIQLYRWFPSVLKAMTIIRPETVVRWHRAGFRCYWRWKSRPFGGRPQIDADLGALIRRMRVENLLWDAPRIHGELLQAEHLNAGTACPGSTQHQVEVTAASALPSDLHRQLDDRGGDLRQCLNALCSEFRFGHGGLSRFGFERCHGSSGAVPTVCVLAGAALVQSPVVRA